METLGSVKFLHRVLTRFHSNGKLYCVATQNSFQQFYLELGSLQTALHMHGSRIRWRFGPSLYSEFGLSPFGSVSGIPLLLSRGYGCPEIFPLVIWKIAGFLTKFYSSHVVQTSACPRLNAIKKWHQFPFRLCFCLLSSASGCCLFLICL